MNFYDILALSFALIFVLAGLIYLEAINGNDMDFDDYQSF